MFNPGSRAAYEPKSVSPLGVKYLFFIFLSLAGLLIFSLNLVNTQAAVAPSVSASFLSLASAPAQSKSYVHNNGSGYYGGVSGNSVSTPAGNFSIDLSNCPTYGPCNYKVVFTPSSTAADGSGTLILTDSYAPTATETINVSASTVMLPALGSTALNFTRTIGTPLDANSSKPIAVINKDGAHTLNISASTSDPANYSVVNCGPVGGGGSCNLTVNFNPSAAGTYNGRSLNVNGSINTPNGVYTLPTPLSAGLNGTATAPTPPPDDNTIGGLVTVDDKPAPGFVVNLSGPDSRKTTTGPDGRYIFEFLPRGSYTTSVIYDKTKYAPVSQDSLNQTLTGNEIEKGENFRLRSLVAPTTVVPTATTAPTTAPPTTGGGKVYTPTLTVVPSLVGPGRPVDITGTGWNPKGPAGQANQVTVQVDTKSLTGSSALNGFALNDPLATLGTFTVGPDGTFKATVTVPALPAQLTYLIGSDLNGTKAQTQLNVAAGPSCPGIQPGNGLRIATKTVQQTANHYFLCIQVVAGRDGVNLNDTVIVTLPGGTSSIDSQAGTGVVTVNGNNVRWGGFSLAAQQSTNLVLDVTTNGSTLDGTNIFVSGRFNRGQAFQQNITGLPPLVEITEIETPASQPGPIIPAAAPSTGTGNQTAQSDPALWIVLGLVIMWLVTLIGLVGRSVRRRS